jgi:anti-anti-sigma factor
VSSPGEFGLRHRELDTHTSVVEVEGDLDVNSAPTLKQGLVDLLATGHDRLVLDLSLVTFMDSTALSVLIGVKRTFSEEGILAIVSAGPAIKRLLEVTGLDHTFELFPKVDAAISYVRERPVHGPDRSPEAARSRGAESEAGSGDVDVPGLSSAVGGAGRTPLTGDAVVALGIAATAMPFALSVPAQAERWLRILGQYGDAAIVLTSVGFTDEPIEGGRPREVESPTEPQTERDPVAVVTEHARLIADERRASTLSTIDLLRAAIAVYDEELERALMRHATRIADLTARLERRHPQGDPAARRAER